MSSTRDPVCQSIEALLRDLEAEGKGTLEVRADGASVEISFGKFKVVAKDRDIALVRLANLMIDDDRYTSRLIEVIKGPMRGS